MDTSVRQAGRRLASERRAMEERETHDDQDPVQVPDEAVEDLSPDAEDSTDVKGGRQVYEWWQKVE
jgi:hypothetical protein